jgi:hypothetical protein
MSVLLEPGSHRNPNDGVCIIELASIIGGERFGDRPRCVCPVLAAYLRGWNDRAGYADRQRLYPYATRVVGTGGYRRISRIRRDICLVWAGADLDRGRLWRIVDRLRMRARIAWSIGLWPALRLKEGAGAYAARVCFAHGGSDEAFALLDRLLDAGSRPAAPAIPRRPAPAVPSEWVPAVLEPPANGNGNRNGHRRDELGIRATIVARERGRSAPRSPAAPASGSHPAANGDRHPDRQARRQGASSAE